MQVDCRNCARSFALDDTKVKKVTSARCLCGVLIDLRPQAFQQQRLGKYFLQRRIAAGGMGEIYYAKIGGVEGFEREVAIKKMLPHLTQDRDFVNMLVKEAKLTVLLHHPNIVQVYDLAKEGDEYYIAMEYVPGINLGNLLEHCRDKKLQLPPPVVAHIMMQALKGLAYAHDLKGPDGEPMHVLHRDITPQNILVTQAGWVKITDFGIAKAKNEISTTSPGIIKGKLGYIAPEQLEGKEPDGRLDIFCAGIVCWEMLAVRRLFKGVDEVDTFRMVSEAKVPPLAKFRQDVPPAIEQAILGALVGDRDRRYRTAHDFYDALAHAIGPRTVDDCAKEAKDFLGGLVEVFAKVNESAPPEPVDGPTVMLGGTATGAGAPEITVTDLLVEPARPRRRLAPLVASLALLAVLGGGGAAAWQLGLLDSMLRRVQTTQRPALTDQEVQLAVDAENERLLQCLRQPGNRLKKDERGTARLVIASTGGVAKIELASPPPERWGKSGTCVERLLLALKFRPHPQPLFEATVQLPPAPEPQADKPAAEQRRAPKPLSEAEITAGVQRGYSAIYRCLSSNASSVPGQLQVKLTVSAPGRVQSALIAPKLTEASVERCLQNALRGLRFREGPKDFEFVLPLTLQRTGN